MKRMIPRDLDWTGSTAILHTMHMPAARTATIVVGDVHGCGAELEKLIEAVERWFPAARLIFVGDLFTKGPEPGRVARVLLDRRSTGARVELICGNHDLRLLSAIVRMQAGASLALLPRSERVAIELLQRTGLLREATRLLTEACDRVEVRDPRGKWTVVHGGIDPDLGVERTPDDVKIHVKALEGEPNWWELYDGRDGLIIVGHRPLREPLILRRKDGSPYMVNVDTGCAYGGALTAYCIDADQILQVPAETTPMPGIEVPSAFRKGASAVRGASGGPVRMRAN